MSAVAGLNDFRKQGPPGDMGTYALASTALVFKFTFSGVDYYAAIRSDARGWTLIANDADPATTINAALADARTHDVLLLLREDWTITDTLAEPAGVHLRGLGWEYAINYNAAGNCIEMNGDDAQVSDLKIIIVAGAGDAGTRPSCIYSTHHTNISVYNVWCYGDTTVGDDGNDFRQCGLAFDFVEYSRLHGNRFENNNRHGAYLYLSSYSNVTGNTFDRNVWHGLFLEATSDDAITGNSCNENTLYGIRLYNSSYHCAVTGNTCNENLGGGMMLEDSPDNLVTGNTCSGNLGYGVYVYLDYEVTLSGNTCDGNRWHGIYLDGSYDNILTGNLCPWNDSGATGTYDGICLNNGCTDNIIVNNNCDYNDNYGISIDSSDCERNWVKNNLLRDNVSGPFNDGGTDTKLETKTFQFTEAAGQAAWQTTSPTGILVNAALEGALAEGWIPLETQMVVRFRIAGVTLAAPGAGNAMLLEIIINSGKPTGHEAYNAEAINVVNKANTAVNPAVNDAVEWTIDATDDADVGDIAFGETFECFAMYETGVGADISTNAVLRTVSVEYV